MNNLQLKLNVLICLISARPLHETIPAPTETVLQPSWWYSSRGDAFSVYFGRLNERTVLTTPFVSVSQPLSSLSTLIPSQRNYHWVNIILTRVMKRYPVIHGIYWRCEIPDQMMIKCQLLQLQPGCDLSRSDLAYHYVIFSNS